MSAILDRRARAHWHELTEDEKREAIRNMVDFGLGDYTIGAGTGLSVEQVRAILGQRREAAK